MDPWFSLKHPRDKSNAMVTILKIIGKGEAPWVFLPITCLQRSTRACNYYSFRAIVVSTGSTNTYQNPLVNTCVYKIHSYKAKMKINVIKYHKSDLDLSYYGALGC